MSCGGGGAGDGGQAEWQRIYDRVEALATRLEVLSEFWDARDKINQALLHQAELSRSRWEAAYRELLPGDNPKLTELLDSDLDDSRTCEALFDTENSELKAQLEEVGSCVHLNENTSDHEHISGDLISELRKLKRAYETLCSNKDKEATEEWQKLQQNIEELQVAAQKKDDEIGRLQAEASASKKKILVLEGDIQKLKVGQPETCKCKLAYLSMMKIGVSMQFPGMCVHYNLEVMESDTVYSVKAKIKGNALGLPIDMQRIEYNDKQLVDGRTLKEQGIQEGAQLVVRVRSQILVKRLTGQLIEFSIDDHFSDTTIYSLKEKICFKIGLAPHLQRLIYNGKWLEDACTLADYNIRPYESTTIRLALNSQGADIDNATRNASK